MRPRVVATLLALLVIMSTAAPATATLPGTHAPGIAKLAPEVRSALAAAGTKGMTAVLVHLGQRADLGAVRGSTRAARLGQAVRALQTTATTSQRPLLAMLRALQARGRVGRVTPYWVFNGIAVTATADAIQALAARPEVAKVTADATLAAPGPVAAGAPPEPNLAKVNAPALWDLGVQGQDVVVASMDTGVDATHPDLAATWRAGGNSWFDPNGEHPTFPTDVSGHGTWTTGVMVGGQAGGTAIGVAPAARWVAVKIFNDRGLASVAGIHAGFQWLLDPDHNPATPDAPHVINSSWGFANPGCNLEFQADLQALRTAGILPVFSAGNSGPSPSTSFSPANYPEAFAVGASRADDTVDPSSSRGPSACGEPPATYPELVAPGVDIYTTDLYGLYTAASGTSLAAPHVSGALALLLSAHPDLTPAEQQAAMMIGAVDIGAPGPDNDSGAGRLDILASHQWLTTRPDFGLSVSPASSTVKRGASTAYTISVSSQGGFAGTVSLSVTGLPSGATATFNPSSVLAPATSTMTVKTTSRTARGTKTLIVTGQSGSTVHQATATLAVK